MKTETRSLSAPSSFNSSAMILNYTDLENILFLICGCHNAVWIMVPLWFSNSNVSRVGSLAPLPNPNLDYQGLHFVWPLPFALPGMFGPTRSTISRQHSSPGHRGAQASSLSGCSSAGSYKTLHTQLWAVLIFILHVYRKICRRSHICGVSLFRIIQVEINYTMKTTWPLYTVFHRTSYLT
jgi:hypothetical protein